MTPASKLQPSSVATNEIPSSRVVRGASPSIDAQRYACRSKCRGDASPLVGSAQHQKSCVTWTAPSSPSAMHDLHIRPALGRA